MAIPKQVETLYEHAGGEAGLHRLEQTVYDSVLRDPLLKPLFREGKAAHADFGSPVEGA